ncbi:MAG: PAS domain S-box protein [Candidatus Omnitrophota bacterium]
MRDFGVDILKTCGESRRACFLLDDSKSALDVVIPYLKAGFMARELCLCLLAKPLNAREVLRNLKIADKSIDSFIGKGQLDIVDYPQWRARTAGFSPQQLSAFLARLELDAAKAGFRGLRIFRFMDRLQYQESKWLMDDMARWQELAQNHRMIFADAYLIKKFQAHEIIRIISCYPCVSHQQKDSWNMIKNECFGSLSIEAATLKKEIDLVLDVTKTGLDIIDEDFNIRFVNTSWAKVYGDYVGKKCYEYFMGRSSVCPKCGLKKAFETKRPVVTQEVLAREGNRRVEVTSIPFQDENGDWLVAEVNLDITERLEVEKQLEENKEYAELLFNLVPSAIFTLDLEKRIVKWNKKAEELTGYSAEEAVGQKCFLFAQEPCNEKCGIYTQDVSKPITNKECSIKRKDGRIRVISKNADFLRDKDNQIIGGIESFEDITSRKRVEEELAAIAQEWNVTFNAISDAIFIVNSDSRIVKFNKAFSSLLSLRPEEVIGRDYCALLDVKQESWPCCLRQNNIVSKASVVLEAEDSVIRKPLLVSISPIFDNKNSFTGAIHIMRDISVVKKAQDELKRRLRDLEVFQEAAVGREVKMIELKQQIKELENRLKEEQKDSSGD